MQPRGQKSQIAGFGKHSRTVIARVHTSLEVFVGMEAGSRVPLRVRMGPNNAFSCMAVRKQRNDQAPDLCRAHSG